MPSKHPGRAPSRGPTAPIDNRPHSLGARDRFLTPDELAELLKVPKETVYQWRRKRTGPPGFRVGRHVRYDVEAVLAWTASQSQHTA